MRESGVGIHGGQWAVAERRSTPGEPGFLSRVTHLCTFAPTFEVGNQNDNTFIFFVCIK